jgi:predicted O-methyltransferase YrrM
MADRPAISTSLTDRETARLIELAADREVLEIGSAYGYSAIKMAPVARSVVAVDPHEWITGSLEIMRANIEAHGLGNKIEVLVAESEEALTAAHSLGLRYGLIFIDGDHADAAVERDARLALRVVADDGTIAFHDYDEETCPGVRNALDSLFPLGPTRLTDSLFEVQL